MSQDQHNIIQELLLNAFSKCDPRLESSLEYRSYSLCEATIEDILNQKVEEGFIKVLQEILPTNRCLSYVDSTPLVQSGNTYYITIASSNWDENHPSHGDSLDHLAMMLMNPVTLPPG